MAICNQMKPGEIYRCETCGLEVSVISPCNSGEEYDGGSGTCACEEPVTCCGRPMTLQRQAAAVRDAVA